MKKKILVGILCASLLSTLCACGKDKIKIDSWTEDVKPSATEEASKKPSQVVETASGTWFVDPNEFKNDTSSSDVDTPSTTNTPSVETPSDNPSDTVEQPETPSELPNSGGVSLDHDITVEQVPTASSQVETPSTTGPVSSNEDTSTAN